MRRVTSFCVLLASSLLLLLHGACSEHAFCRNASDIPKEIERDDGKSVKIFDQISLFESKNIFSVPLVSEETNKYKKPMDCLENEKWIEPIFSKLTKGKEHDIANMQDVETIKDIPRRTHSRIQKRRLMKVNMRGRLRRAALKSALKTSRSSRMKFQKGTLHRVVLKRQVTNSGVRHHVSRRRRVLKEKRRFQMRNLSTRKRISSFRRPMNNRRQARFRRVSARKLREVNDQRRNRVASFRMRVTTRTMQSSHVIGNILLNSPQIRNSKSNIARLSQRTSRRRNFVSKRRRDVYVRSSSRSSRRHTLNSRIRRALQVNRSRKPLTQHRNLVVARRNHSLYRRSTRQERRDTTANHRASLKRFSRINRNTFSRDTQMFGHQRANRQHRRSRKRSFRRYRRVENSEFSRSLKRRSGNQRRICSTRSGHRIAHIQRRSTRFRHASGFRIFHIYRGNYLDKRDTIRPMYQGGNFSGQGNQNKSDISSHELMSKRMGSLLQIPSKKYVPPSNNMGIQGHNSKQTFTTPLITGKTNGEHLFPFEPFQFSKVVITAVGFILGTRVKHI